MTLEVFSTVQRLQCLIVTSKDLLDCELDSSEILQEKIVNFL
jgi:hypothetical protein